MHNTSSQPQVAITSPVTSPADAEAQVWVKPTLERLPLKDALTSLANFNVNDGGGGSSNIYGS